MRIDRDTTLAQVSSSSTVDMVGNGSFGVRLLYEGEQLAYRTTGTLTYTFAWGGCGRATTRRADRR